MDTRHRGNHGFRVECGDGTMIRIDDPWPPGAGRMYGSFSNPITVFTANGLARVPYSLEYVLVPC